MTKRFLQPKARQNKFTVTQNDIKCIHTGFNMKKKIKEKITDREREENIIVERQTTNHTHTNNKLNVNQNNEIPPELSID